MKISTRGTFFGAIGFAFLFLASAAMAQTIKLKITYNGAGVAYNDITVKVGEIVIGTGRTDQNGDVSVSAKTNFPRNVDVYGYVKIPNGERKWDVKGVVKLDGNNFYHLQMDEVLKDMSDMIDPNTLAESWGLNHSTQGSKSSNSNSGGISYSNPSNDASGSAGSQGGGNGGNGGFKGTSKGSTKSNTNTNSGGGKGKSNIAEVDGDNGGNNNNNNNNNGGNNNNRPEPVKPNGYKCKPLSASEYNSAKARMDSEVFTSKKAAIAKEIVRGNCLDALQVKDLVSSLLMSMDQLDLAKYAYDYVANPNDYSVVEGALRMMMDRDELRRYIASRK
jgi:hypothetical protein